MTASEVLERYSVTFPQHRGMIITAANLVGSGHHDATFFSLYHGSQHSVYGWKLRNGQLVTLDPDKTNGEMQVHIRAIGRLS